MVAVDLRDRLRLEHPLVQAALGGGLATAELAGAVSRAGGLGTIGMLAPDRLAREILRARERAPGCPVGAGLLVPFLREAHVDACISARAAAVVLFFGFAPRAVSRLRDAGVLVLHQVGTAAQARRAVADGADALIAQGREAGGHLLGTRGALEFLPMALEAANGRPVLLSGGITDAADVRAAMGGGATGVLCGSRFLLTNECRAHPGYKNRVLGARRTIETELFGFGWPARHRVVPNAATDRWCSSSGSIPASLRVLQRATTLLGRVAPITFAATLSRAQRAAIPLFGPGPALEGAEDRALDTTPLYAGASVAVVGSILPAERAVRDLFPGGAVHASDSRGMGRVS
jgi:nitronate monooxygenase